MIEDRSSMALHAIERNHAPIQSYFEQHHCGVRALVRVEMASSIELLDDLRFWASILYTLFAY
jgi:hypothetical protein